MAHAEYKSTVNTESIASAVAMLKNVNENINGKFDTLKEKAKSLEKNWNSVAGSIACSRMHELFKYSETRNSVMQNYINMLEQQINPGYEGVENLNERLADQFK